MIGRALDSIIGVFSPGWASSRMRARATMAQIEAFGGGPGGYDGGKTNRLNKHAFKGSYTENAIPTAQVLQLRARSWDLYRNNPHARKLVRALEAKVVGPGLTPRSMAARSDGSAHVAFRQRAQALWQAMEHSIDHRGPPGLGGQSLGDLQRLALRSCILSGEALFLTHTTDASESWKTPVPFAIQMLHSERLDDNHTTIPTGGNRVYRGIEVDADFRRVAYWILPYHPNDPLQLFGTLTPERILAPRVGHLYIADDVDQLRGVPWFAPVVSQIRDTGDYQYNELVSSAMAACFAVGVKRPTGVGNIGLQASADWDLTDTDGNPISSIQPGMLVNLGRDGEFSVINPARAQTAAEAWINHLIRSTATGVSGTKASTLTGDYRGSSFSSEKAADNDTWPEIECLQGWFASGFCRPIWEALITTAVTSGYFADVISDEEFADRREALLGCHWQGPVARALNPVDEVSASAMLIRTGLSSPQQEIAKRGGNWRDVLNQVVEFQTHAADIGIRPDFVDQYLGIQQTDNPTAQAGQEAAVDA